MSVGVARWVWSRAPPRFKGASDLKLTEEEVSKIGEDIELRLFNLHNQEVSSKYRNKCRSLLFNLKDVKNEVRHLSHYQTTPITPPPQGLFRKVLMGEVTPKALVRMNAEQLASDELSQWREKTMRKELELIREVAEEEMQMSSSQTIRKMTYKGEVEIEKPTIVR